MNVRTTLLIPLALFGLFAPACAPMPPADDVPHAESHVNLVAVDEPPQAVASITEPNAACPGFRSGEIDDQTRRGRIAWVRSRAAVMEAGDPVLPETLLWLAELSLRGGETNAACEALQRLTAEAAEGEFLETGTCWHEHHCAATAVQCPNGYSQHERLGCQPDAKCEVDSTAQIAPQVPGACERGDAACCPMEGKVHQLEAFRARKAGDDALMRRETRVMQALYGRACAMGHASLCALVAEQLVGEAAGKEATPKTSALSARACALGHWASCP